MDDHIQYIVQLKQRLQTAEQNYCYNHNNLRPETRLATTSSQDLRL